MRQGVALSCSIRPLGWAVPLVLAASPGAAAPAGPAVLENRCLACHGPATRMGGLELATRDSALRGGSRGPALIPRDPGRSLLFQRVLADEMPPGAPLKAAEKETLRAWIEAGSDWPEPIAEKRAGPDWWSLQPLRQALPPPADVPADWRKNPIDRWIHAGLQANRLQPAPEASRRILIRRITFDLLGLPPTPEEIAAFARDPHPAAYERLVDRLLASPHYGERWGRHWLDLVRFSESEGFERDWLREHAWPYRDYVIRSFNEDKEYLRFAREQLAGDVLEPVTHAGIVATSLLTLGPLDAVGLSSAVARERETVREDYLEEMLGVVGQTFLGLTVNCARCHDHKFDPISQSEYYRLKAAFQAVQPPTRPNVTGDLDELIPHGRPLLTPSQQQARNERVALLKGRLESIAAKLGKLYRAARGSDRFDGIPLPRARWTFDTDGRADGAALHLRFHGAIEVAQGRLRLIPEPTPEADGEPVGNQLGADRPVAVSAPIDHEIRAKTLEAWVRVRDVPDEAATLMEIRGQSGFRGASVDGIRYVSGDRPRWENFSIGSFRSQDTGGGPERLEAGARLQVAIRYASDGLIGIYRNGEPYGAPYRPNAGTSAGRLQTYAPGDALVRFPVSKHFEVEEARLYDVALSAGQIAASYRADARNAEPAALRAAMPGSERAQVEALEAERKRLQAELEAIPDPPLVHAASVGAVEPTHVLARGNVDQPGPPVRPGGIASVSGLSPELGLPADAPDAEKRRALAEWIANSGNPLFARVMANRLWQHHFGAGLVANPSDFGYNGGLPSHPELLDWLAGELIRHNWSLKRLHRRILLSRTYRQSARHDRAAAAKDSSNRYLWRYAPRRLTGEAVRDAMLAVSGDLNRELHGPSFRPFKVSKAGSLQRYEPVARNSADFNRRTIYRMSVISGGDPMLEALDCPLPAVKTPKRSATTTSLQALSLMNNEFVHLRAAGFAARLQREAEGLDDQVRLAFRLAFGRAPEPDELASSRTLAADHGLRSLCWGIFNTSEFLHVE